MNLRSCTDVKQGAAQAPGAAGDTSAVEAVDLPAMIEELERVVGSGGVISHADELVVYECDGFTIPRARPLAVVFPKNTNEVVGVVNVLRERGISVLPRGSRRDLTG